MSYKLSTGVQQQTIDDTALVLITSKDKKTRVIQYGAIKNQLNSDNLNNPTYITDLSEALSIESGNVSPEEKALLLSALNLDNGSIPVFNAGVFLDSGAVLKNDGSIFIENLAVGPDSIYIGKELTLTDNVSSVGFTRNSDDTTYIVPSVEITNEGYESSKRIRAKNKISQLINLTTDTYSPITAKSHSVKYASINNFLADLFEFESEGEIDNLNVKISKRVNGEFKEIYSKIDSDMFLSGKGIYVVNSIPVQPVDGRKYVIRDALTGRFQIEVDHQSFVEDYAINQSIFRIDIETSDNRGLRLNSRRFELFPPAPEIGIQDVPVFIVTGHDYDNLDMADIRDVRRKYRDVDSNVTLSTLNDFYTNEHNFWDFLEPVNVLYSDFSGKWREGDSIEVRGSYSPVGILKGSMTISGYTINNLNSLVVSSGDHLKLTLVNADSLNFEIENLASATESFSIEEFRFEDYTTQSIPSTDFPINVRFGFGGTSPSGIVSCDFNGVLTANSSGPMSAKIRVNTGRSGAQGVSELFFQTEMSDDNGVNWSPIGSSSFITLSNSDVNQDFFGFTPMFIPQGTKLRVRWARSSSGNNSGDLKTHQPTPLLSALGFQEVPSAAIIIYKESGYSY